MLLENVRPTNNRLHQRLLNRERFYPELFGFGKVYSTDRALNQLLYQIHEPFLKINTL